MLRRSIISRKLVGWWQTIWIWLHLLRGLSHIRPWWVGIAWVLRILFGKYQLAAMGVSRLGKGQLTG